MMAAALTAAFLCFRQRSKKNIRRGIDNNRPTVLELGRTLPPFRHQRACVGPARTNFSPLAIDRPTAPVTSVFASLSIISRELNVQHHWELLL